MFSVPRLGQEERDTSSPTSFIQHALAHGARFGFDRREQSKPAPSQQCLPLTTDDNDASQCCAYLWFTKRFQQHSKGGMNIISTLQVKKPRLREVKGLSKGKGQSRDLFQSRKQVTYSKR